MIAGLLGAETQKGRSVTFIEAFGSAVHSLAQLPSQRTDEDFPEANAYLLSTDDGLLVRVSRRRPALFSRPNDPTLGYFAEALQLEGKYTTFTVPDAIFSGVKDDRYFYGLGGTYQRIEVADNSSLGIRLTPTQFPRAIQEWMEENSSDVKLALPGNEKEESIGPVGRFLRRRQLETGENSRRRSEKMNIDRKIRERYFRNAHPSGYHDDVANAHLFFTDRGGDHKALLEPAENLGLRTEMRELAPFDFERPSERPDYVGDFISSNKHRPLVATYDGRGKGYGSLAGTAADKDQETHKLFAVVQIVRDENEGDRSSIIRPGGNGFYQVTDVHPDVIRGLYAKIGFDYMLTAQVRKMAEIMPALGR